MSRILLHPLPVPSATVCMPGSKSYTNRALIIASLAPGASRLLGASLSDDSNALVRALRLLGILIDIDDGANISVQGGQSYLQPFCGTIDVGPAGTAMRFLTALCASIPKADVILTGSERMHQRPIGDLVSTLQRAGASITYLGRTGCPPLRIHSPCPLHAETLSIDGSTSSQFISAIALIAPLFKAGLQLSITGDLTSTSYIDMTLQSIRDFGVAVECKEYRHLAWPPSQTYGARTYRIEGDASGASYFWGTAAISARCITVSNIRPDSAQGDVQFPCLLEMMGCRITRSAESITVEGPRELQPIDASLELMPDTAQTLAVVAACARGTSVLRGLKTLRVKETDRIQALQTELAKLGVRSDAGVDYLVVHGSSPTCSESIATYDDHRMAMSFAMLGARLPRIEIQHPEVVNKSFPSFWKALEQVGIKGTVLDVSQT